MASNLPRHLCLQTKLGPCCPALVPKSTSRRRLAMSPLMTEWGFETRESRVNVDGNRLGRIWGCQGGCRAVSNNGGGIRSKCDRWGRDPLEGLGGQHDVRTRNDWMGGNKEEVSPGQSLPDSEGSKKKHEIGGQKKEAIADSGGESALDCLNLDLLGSRRGLSQHKLLPAQGGWAVCITYVPR